MPPRRIVRRPVATAVVVKNVRENNKDTKQQNPNPNPSESK